MISFFFSSFQNEKMSSEKQLFLLEKAKQECYTRMNTEPPKFSNGLWCNRTWDGIMCWNDSPASTVMKQQCPSYIHGFAKNNFAYKKCTNSGTWYRKAETNKTWTDYTSCIDKLSTGIPVEFFFFSLFFFILLFSVLYSCKFLAYSFSYSIFFFPPFFSFSLEFSTCYFIS
ncbi:CALCR [Acanthosepion pharaonis]|uniref:CALCR n=1 Tax=Acanthosepion pharaonis TaxID=158019 RepID=A0A812C3G1_ACAPH|nr:CALCR [Sepia pharaonis]